MSSSSSNRPRGRRRHHRYHHRHPHKYHHRYLLQYLIGHKRFAIDELVNNWRYINSITGPELNRVINVDFISGARTALKLNHINMIYQYSMNLLDEDDEQEYEIHAVEACLNNGKTIRFRFIGPADFDDCTVNGAKDNAKLFYDELTKYMNLSIDSS